MTEKPIEQRESPYFGTPIDDYSTTCDGVRYAQPPLIERAYAEPLSIHVRESRTTNDHRCSGCHDEITLEDTISFVITGTADTHKGLEIRHSELCNTWGVHEGSVEYFGSRFLGRRPISAITDPQRHEEEQFGLVKRLGEWYYDDTLAGYQREMQDRTTYGCVAPRDALTEVLTRLTKGDSFIRQLGEDIARNILVGPYLAGLMEGSVHNETLGQTEMRQDQFGKYTIYDDSGVTDRASKYIIGQASVGIAIVAAGVGIATEGVVPVIPMLSGIVAVISSIAAISNGEATLEACGLGFFDRLYGIGKTFVNNVPTSYRLRRMRGVPITSIVVRESIPQNEKHKVYRNTTASKDS